MFNLRHKNLVSLILMLLLYPALMAAGASTPAPAALTAKPAAGHIYTDHLGRQVVVPARIERIAGCADIIYALKQQNKLVEKGIYGLEAAALAKIDPHFKSLPALLNTNKVNIEALLALKPDIVFANASFKKDEISRMETAGLVVCGIKGESISESFAAVRLVGKVLACEDAAEAYVADCERILALVRERTASIPDAARLKVMFAGPKSVYTVASGDMLQDEIIRRAGAQNVAHAVKGFWADVSPEQVALWNPDIILIGSSKNTYDVEAVYRNTQFRSVTAVRTRRVYNFPSNIGWWDFPAPHCVLGVLWCAKTLYPQQFKDVDLLKIADDFYYKYRGYTFTRLGGKL